MSISSPDAGRVHATDRDRQIRTQYESGDSTVVLADRWGATPREITLCVRRAGGRVRTRTEAMALRWAKHRERQAAANGDPVSTVADGHKRCSRCLKIYPLSEFNQCGRAPDGRFAQCKGCVRKQQHRWSKTSPKAEALRRKHRDLARLRRLGISRETYDAMVTAQGGFCAICRGSEISSYVGRLRELAVDHDHETGVVRELLCTACNRGIGSFKDSPALLEAAAAYLRKHGKS